MQGSLAAQLKLNLLIGVRSRRSSATSATVGPRPFGFCSAQTIGTPSARAPRTSFCTLAINSSRACIARDNFSWMSTTRRAVSWTVSMVIPSLFCIHWDFRANDYVSKMGTLRQRPTRSHPSRRSSDFRRSSVLRRSRPPLDKVRAAGMRAFFLIRASLRRRPLDPHRVRRFIQRVILRTITPIHTAALHTQILTPLAAHRQPVPVRHENVSN